MIDLFHDLQHVQPHVVLSTVTQRLSDRYPGRNVAVTSDETFDVEAWARHTGRATLESPSPSTLVRMVRDEDWYLLAGHSRFSWQGQVFDVVSVLVPRGHGLEDQRMTWVVSNTLADFRALFPEVVAFNRDVHGEVLVFSAGCFSKDAALQHAIDTTRFDDLVLPPALAQSLQQDVEQFLASRAVYERAGAVWKRGILLMGPPGNGKTHAIKGLIHEAALPCVYVKSFTGRYTEPADAIPKVFARARQLAPCVVVLEDLDALIDDENRSFLLNELDGFAANTGIITIASSNHPERLDPSLIHRPSRFDRKYRFDLPDLTLRRQYLERWAQKVPEGVPEAALAQAAQQSEDFTFAYLKELTLSTQMQWASEHQRRPAGEVLLAVLTGLRAEIAAVAANPRPEPAVKPRHRFPFA